MGHYSLCGRKITQTFCHNVILRERLHSFLQKELRGIAQKLLKFDCSFHVSLATFHLFGPVFSSSVINIGY